MAGTLVIIQSTSFCNIDCKYCYLPNRHKTKTISLELLNKIYNGVLESSNTIDEIEFVFHSGEPLAVNKTFYKEASNLLNKVCRTKSRSAHLSIQTNGTLIDEEWADIFIQNNINIGISLDGPDFIHNKNRVTRKGQPTHQKVMNGIKILQNKNIDFRVIMVLTTFALEYPDEIYEFFVNNNINYVGFNIDEFGANSYTSSFSNNMDQEKITLKYKAFMKRFMYLVDNGNGKLIIREFAKVASLLVKHSLDQHQIISGTTVPLNVLNFDVNGNYMTFSPELLDANSERFGNFLMGNINTQNIDDIFSNPKFKIINKELQEGVSQCQKTCKYWGFCGGGSSADKFYETGKLDITETLACKIHTQALVDVVIDYLEEKLT